MRALAAAEILYLWETAHRYHPVDQALALLMAAEPGRSRDDLAALPIGRRDADLLALRQATFGDSMNGCSRCPQCDVAVEFEIACSALRAPAEEMQECALQTHGYQLRVRPLNSFDLAAAATAGNVSAARRVLLRRCVIEAHCGDAVVTADTLPETVSAAVAQAALTADPQAELLLDLTCPVCEQRWQAPLDIVYILWAEVAARAQRLLTEVHLLAQAYGWREADILDMTAVRRASYLAKAAI